MSELWPLPVVSNWTCTSNYDCSTICCTKHTLSSCWLKTFGGLGEVYVFAVPSLYLTMCQQVYTQKEESTYGSTSHFKAGLIWFLICSCEISRVSFSSAIKQRNQTFVFPLFSLHLRSARLILSARTCSSICLSRISCYFWVPWYLRSTERTDFQIALWNICFPLHKDTGKINVLKAESKASQGQCFLSPPFFSLDKDFMTAHRSALQ